MDKTTFKILTLPQWEALQARGEFAGSAHDIRDGFIHLSGGAQLQGTLDKHYTYAAMGGADLILAAVDAAALGSALKYEVSRGGAKFPHLYGPLPRSAVVRHWVLQSGEEGRYDASNLLTDII